MKNGHRIAYNEACPEVEEKSDFKNAIENIIWNRMM